jgi:RNA polymerase sigma factor (sigma-70 family)
MRDDEVADAYRRYGHLVLRRCQRILRNDATAEDALQEVFVRLWRFGDGLRQAESKVSWLYRVADRCCFDLLERRGARAEAPLDEAGAAASRAANQAETLADRDIVLRFLDRFDDRVKQLAVLHYVDELTQEEIARATGWSRQTVSRKLKLLHARAVLLKPKLAGGAT